MHALLKLDPQLGHRKKDGRARCKSAVKMPSDLAKYMRTPVRSQAVLDQHAPGDVGQRQI